MRNGWAGRYVRRGTHAGTITGRPAPAPLDRPTGRVRSPDQPACAHRTHGRLLAALSGEPGIAGDRVDRDLRVERIAAAEAWPGPEDAVGTAGDVDKAGLDRD